MELILRKIRKQVLQDKLSNLFIFINFRKFIIKYIICYISFKLVNIYLFFYFIIFIYKNKNNL